LTFYQIEKAIKTPSDPNLSQDQNTNINAVRGWIIKITEILKSVDVEEVDGKWKLERMRVDYRKED
jgi:hypothetical protein